MLDSFGRRIHYLRLSVTDLCNLRCVYCMPAEGCAKLEHRDILRVEELITVARAAVRCGVDKIRITGGEPLVRRGILDICRGIAAIEGVQEVCMTTNATLLPRFAAPLREAGVTRLNISLDTLDPALYREITRGGALEDALAGLRAAREAGFKRTKVNAVLLTDEPEALRAMAELADREDVELRFIELMPIGECADWPPERFIPGEAVLRALPELVPDGTDGVARRFRIPGKRGAIGLINPLSQHFCPTCNRIRVTADGKLKPCLHSAAEIPLRGQSEDEMVETMRAAIAAKPRRHHLSATNASESLRRMNEIGG